MTVSLKPKDQKPRPKKRRTRKKLVAVKVMRDGREICNLACKAGNGEYHLRTAMMCIRQGHLCGLCGTVMQMATFDHENGRGGGKRDDRIEVNGQWQNAALHWSCNSFKGSRRIPYLRHAVNTPLHGESDISGDRAAVAQEKEK